MTEQEFWNIVDSTRDAVRRDVSALSTRPMYPGDDFFDRQIEKLKQRLRCMSLEEIVDFDRQFSRQLCRAHRWSLWGAVYLIGGGCGDDGFVNFCATLVSLGYELYTRVLTDPDSLCEIIDRPDVPDLQREEGLYISTEVYEEKTGRDLIYDREEATSCEDTASQDFDFDDAEEMRRRYPKLAVRFGKLRPSPAS